jgi:hypothetical protein
MHKYSKYKCCCISCVAITRSQLQSVAASAGVPTAADVTRSHLNSGSSKLLAGNNMTLRKGIPQHITERRGRVVSIAASYPRDHRVQISVEIPAILREFCGFPQSLHANSGIAH